ncbi:MAG: hypothetical protein SFY81_02265 [Verrucomicrobiota bacterium]|nr:hypothetical protein [Verrucomicrobiota bacterium]
MSRYRALLSSFLFLGFNWLVIAAAAAEFKILNVSFGVSCEVIAQKHSSKFGKSKLLKTEEQFGSWSKAQKLHFATGGALD